MKGQVICSREPRIKVCWQNTTSKTKSVTKLKKGYSSRRGVVYKRGILLYEAEHMKRKWEEYVEELCNDNMCGNMMELDGEVDGYEIKMEEMEYAIK